MKLFANLKMNMNFLEMQDYKNNLKASDELVVIPSSLFLHMFEDYNVGAQDVSIYDNGSHTGDISASQLNSLNIKYCLVGHSERRKSYNENNLILRTKIEKLISNNIVPILCIGENEGENLEEILSKQLEVLDGIDNAIIAYEPVWAIGTGKIPSVDVISSTIKYIKSKYNFEVLYGGSVDSNNIEQLKNAELDGFLVGKASCNNDELEKMISIIRQN